MLQLDYRLGGKVRYSLSKDGEWLMLVPDTVRKCVVFICCQTSKGLKYAGTGFFVSMPMKEPLEGHFIYLVTARHVLVELKQISVDQKVYLRINMRKGDAKYVDMPVDDWLCHPDDLSVDVAVLPWAPPVELMDFLTLPISMFATDEVIRDKSIGVGDEVFLTGLFVNHFGAKRNLPIVRIGNIALMPEEPVETKYLGSIDAYLVEARSIGGLSGSPVFVHVAGIRSIDGKSRLEPSTFHLLGLMHGHWDVSTSHMDTLTRDIFEEERVNKGIAIVVPAQKITEVLNQEVLVGQRKTIEKEWRMRRAPTPDGSQGELTKEKFEDALKRVTRRKSKQPNEASSET